MVVCLYFSVCQFSFVSFLILLRGMLVWIRYSLWDCAVNVVKEQLQQNHFCLNILFNLCFIRRHDIEQTTLNYIERKIQLERIGIVFQIRTDLDFCLVV